ncbi:patatin-like phospholipase family protein [bacterium]|nr:patatin-like phospholipase family protein [candidate division CSSED10-310 bacterium]
MMDQTPQPLRTCDIVMKGGITSGVVYPKAISTLARRFIFKNIGGTSAGAIAAACAAAAEYRRSTTGDTHGFNALAELPRLLGEKPIGNKHTRLFLFFQPNKRTRSIFNVLTATLGCEAKAWLTFLIKTGTNYPVWTVLGTLPGLALGILSILYRAADPIAWLWPLISGLLMIAGGIVFAITRLAVDCVREIPRNNFGLCSGLSDPAKPCTHPGREALTRWLTRYLNEIAGLRPDGTPLTFGHLWGTPISDQDIECRKVNLEMMTTNLTHRRPYRLPFRDDADLRENTLFYFRADDFRHLFPESVVQWMIDHPRTHHGKEKRMDRRRRLQEKGYYPMPDPADLPVVVATRMSLSFPILLSAVPLYAIDHSRGIANEQPERCWFSDGGMCSNFPLHFFDTTLPRRPTFSMDLTEKPPGTSSAELCPEMPTSNSDGTSEHWKRFDTLTPTTINTIPSNKPAHQRLKGFFGAMIGTMQNWTDSTQSRLPGFRDRIVRVPLAHDEGGLNLNMPPERIDDLAERGMKAAELLQKHFDVPSDTGTTMTWDNHRWIRLRSYLASLEKSLNHLVAACEEPENGDRSYFEWLEDLESRSQSDDETDNEDAPSYLMNRRQLRAARKTLDHLHSIHLCWDASPAAGKAPRPRPELRPRAQI